MNDFKRICPCCGEKLVLIPPTKELLPERFGISKNGVEYYLYSNPRIRSYTKDPKSNYKGGIANFRLLSDITENTKFRRCYQLVAVHNTLIKLQKGGKSLFSPEMVFFCDYCKAKLALNSNPFAIRYYQSYQITYILYFMMVVIPIIGESNIPLWYYGMLITLFCLQFTIEFVCSSIRYKRICKYKSNFVPTDQFDNLIIPKIHIITASCYLEKNLICESNIYKVKVGGSNYYIYLVNKDDKLSFHICGIDGEPEHLLEFIDKKQKSGEKAILPLSFEGKFVGNAEVIEILESSDPSSDKQITT